MKSNNYKVGIISDTHGLLREEVIKILKKCDFIIHAGDIGCKNILEDLKKIAPVYVVRGNNDLDNWANEIELSIYFKIGNLRFYLIHDRSDIKGDIKDVDIIIFGHSHKYSYEKIGNTLWLNPGSCGKKRFNLPLNLAILNIQGDDYSVDKIDI